MLNLNLEIEARYEDGVDSIALHGRIENISVDIGSTCLYSWFGRSRSNNGNDKWMYKERGIQLKVCMSSLCWYTSRIECMNLYTYVK